MDFDSYSFVTGYFEDVRTGEGFIANFDKEDRFYRRLLPFMRKGKAEGTTSLGIDFLCVPTSAYSDIKKKTFHMTAEGIYDVGDSNG